ncbi:MAG: putative hexuronate transporter [Limisphaerales bacterium]|nr:MAG: putative hexuronate transporter [Limisphaerales bacterium]KAG0508773.1 MAG: putative hexuronate transporter [Limisphaerales bacterium]TXT50536.1 MAG: putative hexuronate transporter [Limisphaerales bacterium]
MTSTNTARPAHWKWLVCGLLLFASMLLYMDRQTLPNVATRVTTEFKLKQEQYGDVEMYFGYAFAVGAFLWGCVADRWSVRWLYPMLVLGWSAMGFFTGLVKDYEGLLICRTLLGFFEAGHWPCALKTTQRLLAREERTMGNSVLQSGASIGAITTPLVMSFMLNGRTEPGVWRHPFLVIGAIGVLWVVGWFALLKERDFAESPVTPARAGDLQSPSESPASQTGGDCKSPAQSSGADANFFSVFSDRRFWALVVVVAAINVCWQIVRAWLPKFLIEGKGYLEADALRFNSLYYIATDIGCLAAGAAALWLVKRGWEVHRSRATVFGVCALLTSLTGLAAVLPRGWALLGVLLVVAAASLGLFPCYYSFSQELSTKHQGKVTGILGTVAWATSSPCQKFFGRLADQTGSFNEGIALAGLTPLIGYVALMLLWHEPRPAAEPTK